MTGRPSDQISLAGWRIDLVSGELQQGDELRRLAPKTAAVLACLVRRSGEVVSKEDLFESVWPDVAVSDGAIWRCISELRQTLGSGHEDCDFLETLPRRGYRLITQVHGEEQSAGAFKVATPKPSDASRGEPRRGRPTGCAGHQARIATAEGRGSVSPFWAVAAVAAVALAASVGFWTATKLR